MDAASAFNEGFSPIIANAKTVLSDPQNVVAKQGISKFGIFVCPNFSTGLASAKDNMDNILDDLEKAAQQPSFNESLEQMKKVLDKIDNDKQRGNQSGLNDDLEALEDIHSRVKDMGDYLVAVNKNPRQRQQLKNNLADLDAIIASIRDNVKNINSSPKDMHDDVVYGKNKIDDIIKGSNAVPLAGAQDVSRANQSSVHAAQRNNPASVKRDADKVAERARALIADVRGASKQPQVEPEQQKRLLRAADNLERALGKYQDAAEKAAANPAAYKAQLKDAADVCTALIWCFFFFSLALLELGCCLG